VRLRSRQHWHDINRAGAVAAASLVVAQQPDVPQSRHVDPSDYFNAWYGKNGSQNYSFWDNKEFQALSAQIDREVDPAKRLLLIHQAEAIMEQDPPLLPIAWETIHTVWYSYLKGLRPQGAFGVYDMVREDTFWLDKA